MCGKIFQAKGTAKCKGPEAKISLAVRYIKKNKVVWRGRMIETSGRRWGQNSN